MILNSFTQLIQTFFCVSKFEPKAYPRSLTQVFDRRRARLSLIERSVPP